MVKIRQDIRQALFIPILLTITIFTFLSFPLRSFGAPTIFPVGLTVNSSAKAYKGYTLYVSCAVNKIFLLDMQGKEVHSWPTPEAGAGMCGNISPLPGGHVLTHLGNDTDMKIVELDWEGHVVWEYYNSDFNILHHDFQRMDNGNTLILGSQYKTAPSIALREIRDDVIVEADQNGTEVWRWSTADHYDELALSAKARKIIFDGRSQDFAGDVHDVFHTNSVQSLPENAYESKNSAFSKGNILVSERNTNIIFIIDKQTGHIIWQMANATIGQHMARMIPKTDMDGKALAGAGNLICFDNGGQAGFPQVSQLYSRVPEFVPTTRKKVWEYNATKSKEQIRKFFSPARSGEQRLPNGNTLIAESEWGRIFEVTKAGETVWEYLNPYFDKTAFTNEIYRAYRVNLNWVPSATSQPALE